MFQYLSIKKYNTDIEYFFTALPLKQTEKLVHLSECLLREYINNRNRYTVNTVAPKKYKRSTVTKRITCWQLARWGLFQWREWRRRMQIRRRRPFERLGCVSPRRTEGRWHPEAHRGSTRISRRWSGRLLPRPERWSGRDFCSECMRVSEWVNFTTHDM